MDTSYISKVEKAKRYAEQPDRVTFRRFVATIDGDNATHTVTFEDGKFLSDNAFYQKHGYSAHTMAMERILRGMIPPPADANGNFVNDSTYISKVEKSKRYAEDPKRITFISFEAEMRGDNSTHVVEFKDGKFISEDDYFKTHGYSAHTMAMERILQDMIPSPSSIDS